MQSTSKEIYKITASRTGHSEQLYKDIGNFVQKETAALIRRPPSLIIKLKGIGYWFLRKKQLESSLTRFPENFEEMESEFEENTMSSFKFESRKEIYKIIKDRLADYVKYLAVKAEVKKKKDEFDQILKSEEDSK